MKKSFDVVVVGGTPAGIMAAIAAAQTGTTVALVEYHRHIGGMSTSGLGKSDIENKDAISGLFREFTRRVHQYYIDRYGLGSKDEKLCREGYYYEPSVAEKIFTDMIAEQSGISLLLGYQIEGAETESQEVREAIFRDRQSGELWHLTAQVFIDATYEGDLYALAEADYRLGREGKKEFGEPHAGKIFFDHNEHVFLPGSTGEGDDKIPAYTYRLCLTDDPENSYTLKELPADYDRNNYIAYFDDLKEGRLGGPKVFREGHGYYPAHFNTMLRVFSFAEIPNRKYDVNINPRAVGFPFPEENYNYVEADWVQRERIFQKHRALTLGLLYFVQNDPEVPEEHRRMAKEYHLPLDEFADNEHFPGQFYVREARRLKGQYTLTENDFLPPDSEERSTIFHDSIIAGEFPIDSFPVAKETSAGKEVLEGYICMLNIAPYQVPLRIMLPEKIRRLIVPVAASTSHVAYSTIRMEPQWMGIGQAAGTLAGLSVKMQLDPADVSIPLFQKKLLENEQVLTFFEDLEPKDKAFQAAQFWGTKGFFKTYRANLQEAISKVDLRTWLEIFARELAIGRIDTETDAETITHQHFTGWLEKLGKEIGLDTTPIDWKYHSGQPEQTLKRGEACLAFYELYFVQLNNINRYEKK